MTFGASFLGGAKSRLLPPSLPFRFFAAANIFHIAMWLALVAAASDMTGFRGGFGPPLAALHLLTLGILTSTAIGAAAQLLPVATRRALASFGMIRLTFWLSVPGMVLLIGGMFLAHLPAALAGAALAGGGLVLFAGMLAPKLGGASSLPVVSAYGWTALGSLLLLVGLGVALVANYQHPFLHDHAAVALAHMILGGFGFMGCLAIGFSHVLVPMFALSMVPDKRTSFLCFAGVLAALALGVGGALAASRAVLTVAALVGLAAVCGHLWQMWRVLKTGMRKRLGLSFVLVRTSWAFLPLTLIIGLAALYGFAGRNGPTLFGFALLFGWLLTFLFAVLQRIMPFLASMFVALPTSGPAIVAEMADATPLKLHAACHGAALALLALAIVFDNPMIAMASGVIGLVGALAFAVFTAEVIRRVIAAENAPKLAA